MATIKTIVGSKVYLGSKRFRVINSSGLLLCADNIGSVRFNTSSSNRYDYENSNAYTYLHNTFYKTLTQDEKNALVWKTNMSVNGFEHAQQNNCSGYFFLPGCLDFFTETQVNNVASNAYGFCTYTGTSIAGLSNFKSPGYSYWLRDVFRTESNVNSGKVWYVSNGSLTYGSMTSSYGLRPICWVNPSTQVVASGSDYKILTVTQLSTPSISSSSYSVKINVSFTISWSSISGATSYKVYRNGSLWTTTSSTYVTDTMLRSWSSVSYYVIATSSSSSYTNSNASNTVTVSKSDTPPTAPGAPSVTLTAYSSTQTKCTNFSWTSSDDADRDTVSYSLEYRLGSGSWYTLISSTTSTSPNQTKYITTKGYTQISFRVKATANSVSTYSSITTKTIPVYNVAPTQPGTPNVTISNITSTTNTCSVSWTASTDIDTVYYSLYYSRYNGSSWENDVYLSKNTTTSRTVSVSTSGYTKVRFKVYATDNKADPVASSYGQATLVHYPTITSSTSSSLGTFTTNTTIPSVTYSVSDVDSEYVTVKEYLNGTVVTTRTPYLSNSTNTYTYTISNSDWVKLPNGTYTLVFEITDSTNLKQSITRTFVKKVTVIDFIKTISSSLSTCPSKIRININKKQLGGNVLTCQVCNNGNDASPTWEDCTPHVMMHKNYYFKNTTKTADSYCIKIRITLSKGTAKAATTSSISGVKGRWA